MMNLNRRAVWRAAAARAARVWPYTCTCRPHVYVHVYVYVLPFRAHRMTMRHEGLIMSGAMSAPGWRGARVCRVTPLPTYSHCYRPPCARCHQRFRPGRLRASESLRTGSCARLALQ